MGDEDSKFNFSPGNTGFQESPKLILPWEAPQDSAQVPKSVGPEMNPNWTPLRGQKAGNPFEFIMFQSLWAPHEVPNFGPRLGAPTLISLRESLRKSFI